MQLAITRQVSRSISQCELTYISREVIDLERARAQHAGYELALREAGLGVLSLPEEADMPDAVFVEDTALILDECAIILRPGATSRQAEAEPIAALLTHFRELFYVRAPNCVDGGDILRLGRRIYVGISQRTNYQATEQLRDWLRPFGYDVAAVEVHGCLHLKSAASELAPGLILVNPDWVDASCFGDVKSIEIDPSEQYAANALSLGDTVLFPSAFPRTRARLENAGLSVRELAVDELAKAEGALTCCSLLLNITGGRVAP